VIEEVAESVIDEVDEGDDDEVVEGVTEGVADNDNDMVFERVTDEVIDKVAEIEGVEDGDIGITGISLIVYCCPAA